jgi:long-chain acyl-CoA synthetase
VNASSAMTPATIFTVFSRSADRADARAALVDSRGTLSFRQLYADIQRCAGYLAQDAEPRPVALPADNPRSLLTAFFASAALGRPALILDPSRPRAENELIIERYGARLLPREQPLTIAPIALPRVEPEAEFYWGLTSGTTGEPKLFARSHRSWLESFRAAEQVFPLPPASKIVIPGPLSHSLFLYGAVHALCRGHTVIAPGSFRPDRAVAAAQEAQCAWLVPAMLAEMLACGLNRASLRLIFCGGAKLSPGLRRQCEAALPNTDLVEFYGASETSFITYASTRVPAPAGSVGRPFPGAEIEVRAGGRLLPQGEEGEIHIASPMLFSRYVGGAAASKWVTAGDIGFVDTAGFLHLTGRVNRIINSRALKIRPEPIELALLELPGVVRAAVVELPDALRGAIAVAAIEFVPGTHLARRTLSAHCRIRLGARFSPRRYFQADRLPLTRTGKIALASIREGLMAGSETFRELR